MQITIETDGITPRDVAGLLALLATVSPDVLTAALEMYDIPVNPQITINPTITVTTDTVPPPPFAPPAPVAVSAPSTTSAPIVPPADKGPQDKNGLTWDERIHAKSADGGGVITGAGIWRAKRGVSPELVAQVTAEQRGAVTPPAVTVPPPPAAPPVPTPPPVATVAAPPPPLPPTPLAPVAEPPPSPLSPPPAAGDVTFAGLCQAISGWTTAGTIGPEDVNAALAMFGVEGLGKLATDAAAKTFLQPVHDHLAALVASKG